MHTSVMNVTVAFGECDPAGIIYYPNYFDWFDRASWALFESAGFSWEVLSNDYEVAGMPLVDAGATFIRAVRWRDKLAIHSRVTRWNGKRFEVEHLVHRGDTLCARGTEMRVWATRHPDYPERLKGRAVPADVIARFDELAKEAAET